VGLEMMKRVFDICIAIMVLVVFMPIILITAATVRIKLGTPVVFKQQRPGLQAVPFSIYKFRTMTDEKDEKGQLLPDNLRLTAFGQFLRKYSLDELPQFFNVLKGELSLVGPRPLLMEYLPLYTAEQAKRHQVKPGITGWAQINGRNALSWEEKFQLDVWYVNNRSFWFELKILMLTFTKVIRSDGITNSNHATMPVFNGNTGKYQG
jgi:sugar transferase EpsL